ERDTVHHRPADGRNLDPSSFMQQREAADHLDLRPPDLHPQEIAGYEGRLGTEPPIRPAAETILDRRERGVRQDVPVAHVALQAEKEKQPASPDDEWDPGLVELPCDRPQGIPLHRLQAQTITPPDTVITCPETKPAPSLTRNEAVWAMSSGRP